MTPQCRGRAGTDKRRPPRSPSLLDEPLAPASKYDEHEPLNAGAGVEESIELRTMGTRRSGTSSVSSVSPMTSASTTLASSEHRFSFCAAGLDATIHARDLAALAEQFGSFTELFKPEHGAFFLDCYRSSSVEMRALSRAFSIHPLTVEDVETEDAREKIAIFGHYSFLSYHFFTQSGLSAFFILVFKEGVICFHREPVPQCSIVRRRMRDPRDTMALTPEWIVYALLDAITDSLAPEILVIEQLVDDVEADVYLNFGPNVDTYALLHRIGEGRNHTMRLIRTLAGKPDVVRGLTKRVADRRECKDIALYLGDVLDHLVTMLQLVSSLEKRLGRAQMNYMGMVQMEFVDATDRMTRVLGKVTIVGVILLPMHLITSLWGMNVMVPAQHVKVMRWFYVILGSILFVLLLLSGGGWLYLRFFVSARSFTTVR